MSHPSRRRIWSFTLIQLVLAVLFSLVLVKHFRTTLVEQTQGVSVNAAHPQLSTILAFQPAITEATAGKSASLDLQLDTQGAPIDHLDLSFTFPSQLIRIDQIDTQNTICSSIGVHEVTANTVHLSCVPSDPRLHTQLATVAHLQFTALKAGSGILQFNEEKSSIESGNQNTLHTTKDGIIVVH